MEVLYRELNRLDNDIDRLQMISILKSHLTQVEMNFERLARCFNDEFYRFKAIEQLLPFIANDLIPDNLFDLFENTRFHLHLTELLKNAELLKRQRRQSPPLTRQSSMSFQIECQHPSISTQTTLDQSRNCIDGSGDTSSD